MVSTVYSKEALDWLYRKRKYRDEGMMIRCNDPAASYRAHKADIDAAVAHVLGGGRYVLGMQVENFEREFSAVVHGFWSPHEYSAVGVANGTDALILALQAAGVGPGWDVLVPAFGAPATAVAVTHTGANVVFGDIDLETLNLSAEVARAFMRSGRTGGYARAAVLVHLFGRPVSAEVRAALSGCSVIVEDCAQTSPGDYGAGRVGVNCTASTWSFYPTKNLGCAGDGGAVVSRDPALLERVRKLRTYGWGDVPADERKTAKVGGVLGRNSRLDEIQAAILRAKLPHGAAEVAHRRKIAKRYDKCLDLAAYWTGPGNQTYHQFVIRVGGGKRDALRERLAFHGVETLVHYPTAVCDEPAFMATALGSFAYPNARQAAREVLSLPMGPHVSEADAEHIARVVNRCWAEGCE